MPKAKTFKKGDRVKYVVDKYKGMGETMTLIAKLVGDKKLIKVAEDKAKNANPLWSKTKTLGTVTGPKKGTKGWLRVEWDNGFGNCYEPETLALATPADKKVAKKFKNK